MSNFDGTIRELLLITFPKDDLKIKLFPFLLKVSLGGVRIFFFIILFNWRIIALQCCVVNAVFATLCFCYTTMQISHNYIYIPSFLSLPRTLPHLTPLGHHRVPCWVPYVMQQLSKEENEKAGLKLTIQKTKIMASSPVTSW